MGNDYMKMVMDEILKTLLLDRSRYTSLINTY